MPTKHCPTPPPTKLHVGDHMVAAGYSAPAVHAGKHERPPSLLTWLHWFHACLNAWLLGQTGGRHAKPVIIRPAVREESGLDEQFVHTLRGWNMQDSAPQSIADAETDHLYDILDSADLLAPLDAPYRSHATDIAFAAGVR